MTVSELIVELQKHPPDMVVTSTGTTAGGYDPWMTDEIVVYQRINREGEPMKLFVGGNDQD